MENDKHQQTFMRLARCSEQVTLSLHRRREKLVPQIRFRRAGKGIHHPMCLYDLGLNPAYRKIDVKWTLMLCCDRFLHELFNMHLPGNRCLDIAYIVDRIGREHRDHASFFPSIDDADLTEAIWSKNAPPSQIVYQIRWVH